MKEKRDIFASLCTECCNNGQRRGGWEPRIGEIVRLHTTIATKNKKRREKKRCKKQNISAKNIGDT